MNKILYILNYQKEIPPFIQMQIKIAKDYFDCIYYVTRPLVNDNSNTIKFENVKIITVKKSIYLINYIQTPLLFFRKKFFTKQLFKGNWRFKRIKHLFISLYASDNLFKAAQLLINKNIKSQNFILSAWFAEGALATARLKKKYPHITTFSFAHSYEIDPAKNPFVADNFNTFKHKYIDEVHYISHNMKNIYYKACRKLNIEKFYNERARITYLGSIKEFDNISKHEKNAKFHIVTCSGVTPVKRLSLLIEALKFWQDGELLWTHLGSGPLEKQIHKEADVLMDLNNNINIEFLGQKTNIEVQKYLAEHNIDLFINVSAAEGVPVSIMESFSYGIPAIATNVGGTSELVIEGENGLLIPSSATPQIICNKIEQYYKFPENQKEMFRNKALEHWSKNFDAVKNMTFFYRNMVDSQLGI